MNKKFWVVVVLFGLFLVWLVVGLVISLGMEKQCFEHGFPNTRITWNYERYCVREVDETEYICKLEDVKSEKCDFDWIGE